MNERPLALKKAETARDTFFKRLWIYETADKDVNIKAIFVVVNTT